LLEEYEVVLTLGAGLDPRENPLTDFLMFTIYLNMDEKTQAMNYLFRISFKARPDIMMAAAELASKVIVDNLY
jgi:hypothetical protein